MRNLPGHSKPVAPPVRVHFWNRDIGEWLTQRPRRVPMNELAVFCRKLSFTLEAGIPVKTALPILAGRDASRTLRTALTDAHIRIMRGESLSGAFESTGAFPPFLCGLCAVGELSARLPQVANQLADYYEQRARSESELSAALVYPAVVTLMMLAVIVISVVFVLPGYARVFAASGVALPFITRMLMTLSGVLTDHAYAVLAVSAVMIAVSILFARSKPGRKTIANLQMLLPVYRLQINLRFTQALCLLLSSGQPLSEAVPLCAQVLENERARRDLLDISAGLSAGRAFWELLASVKYIDPLFVGMARVGEETGRLPQSLDKCRHFFEHAHAHAIRRLNKLVEPAITLVLGLLLGLVMLAVILPTFALTNIY